jgi:arylsulfatase A-like enzyme
LAAVRHGAYKAHFLIPPPGTELGASRPSDRAPQLYDLDQDPSERLDLAGQHPEILAELRRTADDRTEDSRSGERPDRDAHGDDGPRAVTMGSIRTGRRTIHADRTAASIPMSPEP